MEEIDDYPNILEIPKTMRKWKAYRIALPQVSFYCFFSTLVSWALQNEIPKSTLQYHASQYLGTIRVVQIEPLAQFEL